jgi:hypothetical protein
MARAGCSARWRAPTPGGGEPSILRETPKSGAISWRLVSGAVQQTANVLIWGGSGSPRFREIKTTLRQSDVLLGHPPKLGAAYHLILPTFGTTG